MKNLIFILILNVFTLKSQCDYQYTSATFPSSLTINSGETLCVNQDVITAGTTITLNSGGIIISDNVLWHGKVLKSLNDKDTATKTLLEYNTLLKEDPRVETVLLPIRDGLSISRKK